jgi:5-methylthioadenosine/S-adenosylhomocysteine deaminase
MDPMTEHLKQADLAISARWVATVSGDVLENNSVIIDRGKIIDILPTTALAERYRPANLVDLPEQVLLPGLINLHTHAAMSLLRGFADDLPLMTWLEHHIWPAEKRALSERFVHDGTLLGCAEMLAGGVTCFSDMYFYPRAAADAVVQSGMRANLGILVLEFPTAYASDADDYLLKGLEARDSWRSNPLLTTSLAPHAPYTVENRSFEKIMTYAEQLGLGIHTHLHETAGEIAQSLEQFGIRPMQRLAELGVLGPGLVAAHCVHVDEQEMDLLAEYGCHVAHCQTSNLKLASGIAPIASMKQRGVSVGIGTDGAASNNRLDVFAEMRLAALLAKGSTGNAAALPAKTVLQMATLDAARALGLDDRIGSIEIGKYADLTAVRIADPEILPCFDPVSHLVYVTGREHVTHTWVAGDLRYQKLKGQDGVYANIEPAQLKEIVSLWHARLAQH